MPFPSVTCCQNQIMCSGCKNMLIYPAGATSICCALCHAVTPVPTSGLTMARLVCSGCYTLLMYSRGATSVQCSCCRTINAASKESYQIDFESWLQTANQMAHTNCGNCRVLLMYQCEAHSVKCTLCNFVTSVGILRSN
ncbi:hypothetical protein IC582_015006 [Cucumis melo]|uniref:Protein LSD1 n=1 Tax=Cucumis melo TaxID=3656 RepID=A0A1S4DXE8_CUCME|nr:protein LSD1 [Cucumis melo]